MEPYEIFEYSKKEAKKESYDEKLSFHIHNPKIYEHYCKWIEVWHELKQIEQ